MSDPKPADRKWYRHTMTGDRGYLVVREGKEWIKYDRPNQEILRPLHEWVPDREVRPLTAYQVAMVQWSADTAVALALGLHQRVKRTWDSLTDEQRMAFMKTGPQNSPERAAVWAFIKEALRPYADDK